MKLFVWYNGEKSALSVNWSIYVRRIMKVSDYFVIFFFVTILFFDYSLGGKMFLKYFIVKYFHLFSNQRAKTHSSFAPDSWQIPGNDQKPEENAEFSQKFHFLRTTIIYFSNALQVWYFSIICRSLRGAHGGAWWGGGAEQWAELLDWAGGLWAGIHQAGAGAPQVQRWCSIWWLFYQH